MYRLLNNHSHLFQMASRFTWQVGSVVFIVAGVVGKVGAILAMVPNPVVGGLIFVGLGMCFSIAITNLQHVNINCGRNQMVLGLAMVTGVVVPIWLKENKSAIDTGRTI